jgi:Mg-chelatase subunit ChlD
MNKVIVSFAAVCLSFAALAEEPKKAAAAPAPADKPRVEVCFVLDTTGSMSGLIEGAKAKIWSIANQIVKQKPSPDVKIALIGYRDRGDQYVTKRFDLTDDIDKVFKNLTEFSADGGGDEPESVNLALDEAVNKIAWSADRKVLKVIFLVGDAPPHMDYKGEKQYPEICKEAVKKDLIVNTVQCGNLAGTADVWKAIAKSSEGEFAAIAQTGNVTVVSAPQDKEIAELNAKIGTTLLPCATGGRKYADALTEVKEKQAASEKAPASVAADRRLYLREVAIGNREAIAAWAGDSTLSTSGGAEFGSSSSKSVLGDVELIDLLNGGKVKLEELKDDQLPPEMRKMTPDERKAFVATKAKERAGIYAKIEELSKARAAYLEAEKKKALAASPAAKGDAFDEKVGEVLSRQAEAKRK